MLPEHGGLLALPAATFHALVPGMPLPLPLSISASLVPMPRNSAGGDGGGSSSAAAAGPQVACELRSFELPDGQRGVGVSGLGGPLLRGLLMSHRWAGARMAGGGVVQLAVEPRPAVRSVRATAGAAAEAEAAEEAAEPASGEVGTREAPRRGGRGGKRAAAGTAAGAPAPKRRAADQAAGPGPQGADAPAQPGTSLPGEPAAAPQPAAGASGGSAQEGGPAAAGVAGGGAGGGGDGAAAGGQGDAAGADAEGTELPPFKETQFWKVTALSGGQRGGGPRAWARREVTWGDLGLTPGRRLVPPLNGSTQCWAGAAAFAHAFATAPPPAR